MYIHILIHTHTGTTTRYIRVGTRVAKEFVTETGEKTFFGKVTAVYKDDKLWHVRYEDGDEEDLNSQEIVDVCQRYCDITHDDDDCDDDDDYLL